MKKVLGIALLLVVLVSAMASAVEPANQSPWRLYLKATNSIGSFAAGSLTMAIASNGIDGFGSTTGDTVMGFTSFQPTAACVAGLSGGSILSVDAKSPLAPGNSAYNPTYEKVWDLRVGAFASFVGPTIKLTMTDVSSAAGVPPATALPNYKYFVRMVDNKSINGAPANGTVWDITMPAAYTTNPLWTLDLPTLFVSKDAAGMESGYKLQFVQAAVVAPVVPEPSSLMAMGAGLMGLVGFASRRRRS